MADETEAQSRQIVTRAEAIAAGLKRYFTGNPCIHGHVAERWASSQICVVCQAGRRDASYEAAYRATHAEERRETEAVRRRANPGMAAKYYAAHREEAKAYAAAWRAANPDKVKETAALNYARNREGRREHYEANKDRIAARNAAWKAANKESVRAHRAKRIAKAKSAPGSHTGADIKYLLCAQKRRCAHSWCRASLSRGYHIDHIIALSRGGSNDRRNLQLLCRPCNLRKAAKHPIDFAQEHGLLL